MTHSVRMLCKHNRLAVLSLIILCLHVAECSSLCEANSLLTQDKYLQNSVFFEFNRSDIFSCASQCQMYKVCESFSFQTDRKRCYLNFGNSNTDDLISRPGFVHSNISRWPQIGGRCSSKKCGTNSKCHVSRDNSKNCEKALFRDVENDSQSYYRVLYEKKDWDAANNVCMKKGGHLLFVENETERKFILHLLTVLGRANNQVWIGLRYDAEKNDWIWSNGEPVLERFWESDSRDASAGVCAYMDGHWFNDTCSGKHNCICEYD